MKTNVNALILVFLSPLLTSLSPIVNSLVALSILVIINLITDIISNYKECKEVGFWKRFRCIFMKRTTWVKTFKKCYEYMFAILTVGLFEVYILGTQHIEVFDGIVSLTKGAIIFAAAFEVDEIFKNIEEVTGTNIYQKIKNLVPDKLKSMLTRNNK